MNKEQVLTELQNYADEATKRTLMRHGAREPFYGVKVEDLKKIQKKIKKDYELALELYATGISDAMYLAGLIADESKMTREQLDRWADEAYWYMISEYTVPWVASESRYGFELGLKWIDSDEERIASTGWATLASLATLKPDDELDLTTYSALLDRVEKTIHESKNRERYTMNGFVITVGSCITSLTQKAMDVAYHVGKVSVNMGDTACKVPLAVDYIQKIVDKNNLGKKRKSARC